MLAVEIAPPLARVLLPVGGLLLLEEGHRWQLLPATSG